MPVPESLSNFNIAASDLRVWLFRTSGSSNDPVFTGHWIETGEALDGALRTEAANQRAAILETLDYDILAPAEDGQALIIPRDETFADRIVDATADPLPKWRARQLSHMRNTKFYVVKFVHGDAALYAIRRTDDSWSTRKSGVRLPVVFAGEQLELEPNPIFALSRHVDFFVAGDDIVILNKKSFESVLFYKQAHLEDFEALRGTQAFLSLFTDLGPLVEYVGTNKLRLRRISAVRQKAHFENAVFMQNLRDNFVDAGLNLTFDANGRFIPTEEQSADIITALLNHRLYSRFSQGYFDVQHATAV